MTPFAESSARPARRLLRRLGAAVALAGAMAGLGACSSLPFQSKGEDMGCPEIRVDRATSRLTQFAPGGGQDITDIVLEAQIASLDGDCGYDSDSRTLDVKLKVLFQVSRGPAMQGLEGSMTYFVAVPAYYPNPGAKQILPVTFQFPEGNVNTMMIRDEEVRMTLPLGQSADAEDVPIYVGFQLSPSELQFNRKGM